MLAPDRSVRAPARRRLHDQELTRQFCKGTLGTTSVFESRALTVVTFLLLCEPHLGCMGVEKWLGAARVSASSLVADDPGLEALSSSRLESTQPASGQFGCGQWEILERIARGASLTEILLSIVGLVEHQAEGMLCSISIFEPATDQLRHGAARRLASELCAYIDGMRIGPNEGSCGIAAFSRQRVVVTDIATHPAWARHKQPFLEHGLRACWSTPIMAPAGELLGTLGMYFAEARGPSPAERGWVDGATYLAAIALSRARAEHTLQATLSELRDKNQKLEFHVSRMPLGYVVWDRQLTVTEWNGAAARIFGWSAEDVVGKRSRELAIFSDADLQDDPLARQLRASRAAGARGTHEHVHKSGARLVCEWLHAPLKDDADQVVGYLSMAHDVTERKHAEEERKRLESRLRQGQRIQALGVLAGGIAHDFNNILTAISGHTHLGLNDIEEERSPHDSLLAIQEASARAVELVRRILMFSRYQRPERKLCSITAIVDEALGLLRGTLPSGVSVESKHAASPMVNADPDQLHQVIMSLGANAGQAIGESGNIHVLVDSIPRSHLELEGSADARFEHYVRITLTDSGAGMDEATLERIFEPFFTTKPTGQGSGLGLSVVHGIVKGHEGKITVQSRPGKGSAFRIYLPEVREAAQAAGSRPPKAHQLSARIMYVDDEEPLVELATRWLGRLGYEVTGFSDSTQALEAFRARPFDFDAVISDFAMPGMSGLDLVEQILALRKDVIVVMSSGYLRVEDQERARLLGAVDVVLKPQSMTEFGRILHRALRERQSALAASG
jgi:PAS domain S-box-containing protein